MKRKVEATVERASSPQSSRNGVGDSLLKAYLKATGPSRSHDPWDAQVPLTERELDDSNSPGSLPQSLNRNFVRSLIRPAERKERA